MPVKLRLQRHGRKGYAFYHIVAADSRAPRDGKFIERVGSYNPNTNPVTIILDFEKALHWLNVGAQPTDTVRNILSKEGVLMKKHLQGGVKKGAFSEEEAEKRFEAWKQQKEEKISKTKAEIEAAKQADVKARLAVEAEQNKERAKLLAEKKAEALAAQA
ncbi:MAG: 30S ribosomal protein S16, partial [Paludibacter sp.]